jgi:Cobalamin biosynthesis protein CobT (nicotinate-mononucleotide:5, 6-dimethylbenzimidazole phosphoribosyltransferase)
VFYDVACPSRNVRTSRFDWLLFNSKFIDDFHFKVNFDSIVCYFQVQYGLDPVEVVPRRTRGRQINYQELLDDSEEEEILGKKPKPDSEEEEFKVGEDEEEKEEEEDEDDEDEGEDENSEEDSSSSDDPRTKSKFIIMLQ